MISGTVTTDPTGVEDMSQYGEVQDASVMSFTNDAVTTTSINSDEFEQQLDVYIEMLADPNSEINMEIPSTYELVK